MNNRHEWRSSGGIVNIREWVFPTLACPTIRVLWCAHHKWYEADDRLGVQCIGVTKRSGRHTAAEHWSPSLNLLGTDRHLPCFDCRLPRLKCSQYWVSVEGGKQDYSSTGDQSLVRGGRSAYFLTPTTSNPTDENKSFVSLLKAFFSPMIIRRDGFSRYLPQE